MGCLAVVRDDFRMDSRQWLAASRRLEELDLTPGGRTGVVSDCSHAYKIAALASTDAESGYDGGTYDEWTHARRVEIVQAFAELVPREARAAAL